MKRMGERGLTLVELAVTLAIIGILATIALPNLMATMPRYRLTSNARVLSNDVALTRVRAIAQSTRFRLEFTCTSSPADCTDSYRLQKETGMTWIDLGATGLSGSDLKNVENVINTSGSMRYLISNADGTMNVAYGEKAYLTLKTPDGVWARRVVIEPMGQVVVEKSSDGGASWKAE